MKRVIQQHTISFTHAIHGLMWALRTQPNFRVHLFLGTLALYLCWYLRISRAETAVVVLTVVVGLGAEMINTALESMTDLITTEWRQEAKIAKDVAAGMMLVVALGAVLVAIFVYTPYIAIRMGY